MMDTKTLDEIEAGVAMMAGPVVWLPKEQVAELVRDARRYGWLQGRAHKNDAYDRYGPGAQWSIGLYANDSRHTLDAAIDAAIAEESRHD